MDHERTIILEEVFEGIDRGHYTRKATVKKVLHGGLW
jgi:hypothetical protein